jgi:hypothetical protein
MAAAVLQGDLSSFRLPEVLSFLSTNRKSGMLTVTGDGKEATLFFTDGALVYAGSTQEQFRLGYVLLRKKMITTAQRDGIDALMRREGGRFGQIAIQQGILTEPQLQDFLKVQVSEIVFDAFVWDAGTFAFAKNASLPPYAVTISIDLANLIMEGARRIDEWERCAELLPDKTLVFRVVAAPRDEKITLTAEEWRILFLINGVRTIEELVQDSEDDAFHVYRVLYGLYANKLIEPVGAREPDDTMRQTTPRFGSETTVQDQPQNDDTSLLLSSEPRLSYADMVRPTVAQLRVEATGTLLPLTEPEYLIGRHRENNIQLPDPGISGFHARIYQGPQGYVVEDLKSRNGTWVNGERVTQVTLATGDRIHVGQTDLTYELLL